MDHEFEFVTRDGRHVLIVLDEWEEEVRVFKADGDCDLIGKIGYILSDDNDEDGAGGQVALLNHLYLEGPNNTVAYKRQGIGSECVRILSEQFGYTVTARRHNGQVLDDGSYLTGDAPAFVEHLVAQGLVHWHDGYDREDLDDDRSD